jgi:hypothetical protein
MDACKIIIKNGLQLLETPGGSIIEHIKKTVVTQDDTDGTMGRAKVVVISISQLPNSPLIDLDNCQMVIPKTGERVQLISAVENPPIETHAPTYTLEMLVDFHYDTEY